HNMQVPRYYDSMRREREIAVDSKTSAEKVLGGAVGETDHIVPQGMPGYYEDLKPLEGDFTAPSPGKLTLSYTTGQTDFDKVAAAVQQMWKQNLRLDVQLNGEEQGKFNDDLTAMANDPTKSNIEM